MASNKYITVEQIKNGFIVQYGFDSPDRQDSLFYEDLNKALSNILEIHNNIQRNTDLAQGIVEPTEEVKPSG